jgi:hypothetical protein
MSLGPASLHARNAVVLAIVMAAALLAGRQAIASAALGGALEAVNLLGLARGVRALVARAETGAYPGVALFVGVRVLALLGSVGAALLLLPVDPLWFVLGLSTAVPAAIWHGLSGAPARVGAH